MSDDVTGREQVIEATRRAVMADRNADYAPPEENFQRIADLWNLYLEGKGEVTPYDTAIMMVLVKVARVQASPHLVDHLVDIAGYAACAADVIPGSPDATPEPEPEPEAEPEGSGTGWYLDSRGTYEGKPGEIYSDGERFRMQFDEGGRVDFDSKGSMLRAQQANVLRVTAS